MNDKAHLYRLSNAVLICDVFKILEQPKIRLSLFPFCIPGNQDLVRCRDFLPFLGPTFVALHFRAQYGKLFSLTYTGTQSKIKVPRLLWSVRGEKDSPEQPVQTPSLPAPTLQMRRLRPGRPCESDGEAAASCGADLPSSWLAPHCSL